MFHQMTAQHGSDAPIVFEICPVKVNNLDEDDRN